MKILGGDLEASNGNVAIDQGERLGKFRQDRPYEEQRVLDVVLMGHAELWETKNERDGIYANPDASEEDYARRRPRGAFRNWTDIRRRRAGELPLGLGIPTERRRTDERGGAWMETAGVASPVRQSNILLPTSRPITSTSTRSAGCDQRCNSTMAILPRSPLP